MRGEIEALPGPAGQAGLAADSVCENGHLEVTLTIITVATDIKP